MLNRGNTYFERSMDLITKPFIQNKQVKSKFIDGQDIHINGINKRLQQSPRKPFKKQYFQPSNNQGQLSGLEERLLNLEYKDTMNIRCLACTPHLNAGKNLRQRSLNQTHTIYFKDINNIKDGVRIQIAMVALINKDGGIILFGSHNEGDEIIPNGQIIPQERKIQIKQTIKNYFNALKPMPVFGINAKLYFKPVKTQTEIIEKKTSLLEVAILKVWPEETTRQTTLRKDQCVYTIQKGEVIKLQGQSKKNKWTQSQEEWIDTTRKHVFLTHPCQKSKTDY